ncbi:class I SAM-dependent methyltransferase [Extensimonas sp. H3M7-6]|uniref:class I SAM-dependent methyltransferase n=1 Tax=Extensimonas soli TaxID=3031322 RepID=UPI0023DA45A0|nr:class I SAM-dependent methyltransferase [Extensimonas sp. H3M7-6]MDF1482636.1 class I SAM-dependent methyltransferase [Extensimonas sp. H3M7-6]
MTDETGAGSALVRAGQLLLAQGDRQGAAQVLALARAKRADLATMLQAHALIEGHDLPGSFSNLTGVDCRISPEDDIFRFFARHPSSLNPLRDYFADGWRTLAELMVLLERLGKPLLQMQNVLEFASGHGRFTRHLTKALGAERVTVSDVVADAVEFSKATFGVQGFVSASVPEQVRWPGQFDLVFVLSLFSHLPRTTWGRWLRALHGLLAPGGVLVFTVHGMKAAAFDQVILDEDGYFFAPSSESRAIAAQEYGTTFTAPQFVQAQIAETVGLEKLLHFAPVHFWNHQDAYVLAR